MTEFQKVFNVAKSEIGYLEKNSNKDLDDKTKNAGSGNYTKYWRDLDPSMQGQYWCNAWLDWIFYEAFGTKRAKELLCTSGAWSYYTPTSAQYFKDKKQWYTTPKKGDVVFFRNSTRICHIGFVYKVDEKYVYTIEGNTSGGNTVVPNGGGVAKKKYTLGYGGIAGFGRPKYKESVKEETKEKVKTETDTKNFKAYQAEINVNSLNGREKPSLLGKVVKILKKGEKYTIVEEEGTWGKSSTGIWMSTKYLKKI